MWWPPCNRCMNFKAGKLAFLWWVSLSMHKLLCSKLGVGHRLCWREGGLIIGTIIIIIYGLIIGFVWGVDYWQCCSATLFYDVVYNFSSRPTTSRASCCCRSKLTLSWSDCDLWLHCEFSKPRLSLSWRCRHKTFRTLCCSFPIFSMSVLCCCQTFGYCQEHKCICSIEHNLSSSAGFHVLEPKLQYVEMIFYFNT